MWLTLVAVAALGAAERPKLIVMDLTSGGGVEPSLTAPVVEAITNEVQARGFFEVLSTRDVQALLGLERQKQLMGCSEAESCMTELSGAIGARFVMSGSLARLGDAYQLTLTTMDSQKAQPLGRATRLARSLEALRTMLPYAVAEATSTPLPPPPSRALPITLLGGGGALALFGIVWTGLNLSQEQQLATLLDAGANTPGLLGTRASYQSQLKTLQTQRWVGVAAAGVGIAAVVAGALLMPSDGSSARIALLPTGTGVAIAGVF